MSPKPDVDVSVVIPTHNRRDLVMRALQSVREQSVQPLEVIVIDDGSIDDTASAIAVRYPEVIYQFQAQSGVSAARNKGIDCSRGQWLAFLDSDDEWTPNKLARQMEALERQPEYRFCHTDEIWIRNGRRVNPGRRHSKKGGWMYRDCLPLCAISPSSSLVHRAVLEDVGCFDEQMEACEDYDLWLRISAKYPVLLVDELLVVKHGGHDDQLSNTVWGLDRLRIHALEKMLTSNVLNREDFRATLEALQTKLEVYMTGAVKRGRSSEVERLQGIIRRWEFAE
jgi:glycosyltransferase involved in cell wall biosynthesis